MSYICGENVTIKNNVTIKENVIIGNNVILEDNVYLDYGVIIRDNVHIKEGSFIGARSIIGEYQMDFYADRVNKEHPLIIGKNALIRSEAIIYSGTTIGDNLQTGHRINIRENAKIGNNFKIGNLSDVQGDCVIGNHVSMHCNSVIGEKSIIEDYVWIFPYVILTNDPTPPSETRLGVTIKEFAVVATGTVILPGVTIGKDAFVGAGTLLSKDVREGKIVIGNPCKEIGNTTRIRNKETGESIHPWRYTFDRGMPWKGIGYDNWIRENNK